VSMSLSASLGELIRSKSVSKDDLHSAALFSLDAIANALAGRKTKQGQIFLRWGREQGSDAGRLAFVLGGCTHILETDDLHRASVTHPGCVVVPAAVALANREASGGVELLNAILHGFEAMCRVGNAVGAEHYKIWHNTATCGPFGSAMAAASLLRLDDVQTVNALGNAGTQSSGLWQFLETGAMSKHLHAGRAAESGLVAADLAALGFTGPPEILEGAKGFFAGACPDAMPARVTADADADWQLVQTSIKPWPCCRHTHPTIDAALALRDRIDGQEIASVQIETYPAATNVCDRPTPQSEYEAKFSLYHCVAVALQDGAVGFDSFDPDSRERLASTRSRVTVSVAEPWASAYPDAWGGKVSLTTTSGEEFSEERLGAKGDPEMPLSDAEMISKAKMLLEYAELDNSDAFAIVEGVLNLPDGGSATSTVAAICAAFA
jgi:2-methylcitrate dehydratase PrpD